MAGECTLVLWYYRESKLSGRDSIFEKRWYSANGASFTEDYTSRTSTAIHPAGNIVVGDGYNGRMESGYIAEVMVYNRTLTDVEILYNYCEKRQIWSLTCCNAQCCFCCGRK